MVLVLQRRRADAEEEGRRSSCGLGECEAESIWACRRGGPEMQRVNDTREAGRKPGGAWLGC